MTKRCKNPGCFVHDGESCAAGEPSHFSCEQWASAGDSVEGKLTLEENIIFALRGEGGELVAQCMPHRKAEAIRLVACWNACEGSTTEWLEFQKNADAIEQFGTPEPFETRFGDALRHGVKFMDQRNELLEVLRHIEGAAMDIMCERRTIRDAASAAIAKATKETI